MAGTVHEVSVVNRIAAAALIGSEPSASPVIAPVQTSNGDRYRLKSRTLASYDLQGNVPDSLHLVGGVDHRDQGGVATVDGVVRVDQNLTQTIRIDVNGVGDAPRPATPAMPATTAVVKELFSSEHSQKTSTGLCASPT